MGAATFSFFLLKRKNLKHSEIDKKDETYLSYTCTRGSSSSVELLLSLVLEGVDGRLLIGSCLLLT
jgi:hypothetical protein